MVNFLGNNPITSYIANKNIAGAVGIACQDQLVGKLNNGHYIVMLPSNIDIL